MGLSCLASAILCLFLSPPFLTSTQSFSPTSNTTVLDAEGYDLQPNTMYYVFPVQRTGNGGGLALASRDRKCPYYVIEENYEPSNGLSLRFVAVDNKPTAISLSTDLNFVFNAATICVQSTTWRLGDVDDVTGHRYVISGGRTGRPGVDTVSNWFKIEKFEDGDGYKIVFCPSVCNFCKVVCGNVGVFIENGKRWLGLSDEPLVVLFKKV
ncbi:hypothetical protein RJ640_005766 [Escallonia rubra]|uniref:Uncharacterized protein n=1 Tax=Escallonia rubra TaxID=112253 RepID=A0AA88UUA3_9ASTE|nr:hypothetical protein RJ640_005766 [Escallonia rubra]